MVDTEIKKYRVSQEDAQNYFLTNRIIQEHQEQLWKEDKLLRVLIKDFKEFHDALLVKADIKDKIIGKMERDEEGFYFTLFEEKK